MSFASYFARAVDEAIPLIDDVYVPPVEPPVEPAHAPRPLRLCSVLATLWYIGHAAIVGAALIYLVMYPLPLAEYVNDWRAIVIGLAIGFVLCGITLTVHRICQRS